MPLLSVLRPVSSTALLSRFAFPFVAVLSACSSEPPTVTELDEDVADEATPLITNLTYSNGSLVWDEIKRRNLTYCIDSTTFTAAQLAQVRSALASAAATWQSAIDVRFVYVAAENARCDDRNRNVVFDVRGVGELPPRAAGETFVSSFSPSSGVRYRQEMFVSKPDLAQSPDRLPRAMLHALGHVLGFKHEADPRTCGPVHGPRRLGFFDVSSVMMPSACGGGATLSEYDVRYAQMVYAAPPQRCSAESLGLCAAFGATCEVAVDTSGVREDLCRWNTSPSAEACAGTNGTWVPKGSAVAQKWPSMVYPLRNAACVRLVSELRCAEPERLLCERHGAQCERSVNSSGRKGALCRWTGPKTESACHTFTTGKWIPAGSSFDTTWPTAVPSGDGACVTRATSLNCTADERKLCEEVGGLCQVSSVDGVRRNICLWPTTASTETLCQATYGTWVTRDSELGRRHRGALRQGLAGVCMSEVASLPRVWERGCGAARPTRFFFERPSLDVRCSAVPGGATTSFRVRDAVQGFRDGMCVAEWTGSSPMTDADRDLLQSWASTFTGDGLNTRTGLGYAIRPSCAEASPVCALGQCPRAPEELNPTGNRLALRDFTSGCPKCATLGETSLFVVLDPQLASTDLVAVPYTGTSTAVVKVNGQGKQLVEVPLSPATRAELGDLQVGTNFVLLTQEELDAKNDVRQDDWCAAPAPPPECAGRP